jgi:uncharacterized protein (TIGR02246 family)
VLDVGGDAARDAVAAVQRLVAELQEGWTTHDADVTDGHYAGDIMWGSPFGATVRGYDELHAIHVELKRRAVGGPASRFEAHDVVLPAPGVALAQIRRTALAQIRRTALDDAGRPVDEGGSANAPFSEMALYVLVERDSTWWVAAGQNTPIGGVSSPD